jgi:hypothetical protein
VPRPACLTRLTAALALGVALLAGPLAAQDRISRDEGRQLAAILLRDGQPAAARDIAAALVTADAADTVALILLSRAERLLGNADAALAAAGQAWSVAQAPDQRFGAAVVRAQALTDLDRPLAAGLWFRRAVQAAETDEARAFAIAEAQEVRANSPLSVNLSFAITPRSNINNGGANDTYALHPDFVELIRDYLNNPNLNPVGNLREGERPLAGVELRGSVALSYRLHRTNTSATEADVRAHLRSYVLSSDAQAAVPDATGWDYSDAALTFGLTHSWQSGDSGPQRLRAEAGLIWYGGAPYSQTLRLSYGRAWAIGEADRLSGEISVTGTAYDGDRPNDYDVGADLAWRHALASGGTLTVTGGLGRLRADDPDRGFRSVSVGLGWSWNDNPANSLFLGVEGRDYDQTLYIVGTRRDLITTARVSVAVPGVDLYGFQPVVTVEARDLSSNAERPESRGLGAGIGFISSF